MWDSGLTETGASPFLPDSFISRKFWRKLLDFCDFHDYSISILDEMISIYLSFFVEAVIFFFFLRL